MPTPAIDRFVQFGNISELAAYLSVILRLPPNACVGGYGKISGREKIYPRLVARQQLGRRTPSRLVLRK
jgi:hypothetical protein